MILTCRKVVSLTLYVVYVVYVQVVVVEQYHHLLAATYFPGWAPWHWPRQDWELFLIRGSRSWQCAVCSGWRSPSWPQRQHGGWQRGGRRWRGERRTRSVCGGISVCVCVGRGGGGSEGVVCVCTSFVSSTKDASSTIVPLTVCFQQLEEWVPD